VEIIMKTLLVSAATFIAIATAANATDICKTVDKAQWMSKDEITAKVTALGYEVRKVQEEDGCWEVKGMKDGQRVEAYFDPVSAELVLSK
jgi:hypothetical protein